MLRLGDSASSGVKRSVPCAPLTVPSTCVLSLPRSTKRTAVPGTWWAILYASA